MSTFDGGEMGTLGFRWKKGLLNLGKEGSIDLDAPLVKDPTIEEI